MHVFIYVYINAFIYVCIDNSSKSSSAKKKFIRNTGLSSKMRRRSELAGLKALFGYESNKSQNDSSGGSAGGGSSSKGVGTSKGLLGLSDMTVTGSIKGSRKKPLPRAATSSPASDCNSSVGSVPVDISAVGCGALFTDNAMAIINTYTTATSHEINNKIFVEDFDPSESKCCEEV